MADVSASVESNSSLILGKLGVCDQSKVHHHFKYVLVPLNLRRNCLHVHPALMRLRREWGLPFLAGKIHWVFLVELP